MRHWFLTCWFWTVSRVIDLAPLARLTAVHDGTGQQRKRRWVESSLAWMLGRGPFDYGVLPEYGGGAKIPHEQRTLGQNRQRQLPQLELPQDP